MIDPGLRYLYMLTKFENLLRVGHRANITQAPYLQIVLGYRFIAFGIYVYSETSTWFFLHKFIHYPFIIEHFNNFIGLKSDHSKLPRKKERNPLFFQKKKVTLNADLESRRINELENQKEKRIRTKSGQGRNIYSFVYSL